MTARAASPAEPRVFVSHAAAKDGGFARRLCAGLEARGVPCWIAPRDAGGGEWAQQIDEALSACQVLLVVVSPAAERSEMVRRELARAAALRKPFVPVRRGEQPLHGALEFFVSAFHHEIVSARPPARELDRLARVVRRAAAMGSRPRVARARCTRHTVALLPWTASGTRADAELARGLGEVCAAELARDGGCAVIPPASLPPSWEQDARAAARACGATLLLTGVLLSTGRALQATVTLVDVEHGHTRWAASRRGSTARLLALEDEMLDAVRGALRATRTASGAEEDGGTTAGRARFLRALGWLSRVDSVRALRRARRLLDAVPLDAAGPGDVRAARARAAAALYDHTDRPEYLAAARHEARLAAREHGSGPATTLALAHVALRTGHPEQAESLYRRALEQSPRLVEAYVGLARVHATRGAWAAGATACRQALRRVPGAWIAWDQLGKLWFAQGRFRDAAGAFARVAAAIPHPAAAHANRAAALFLAGDDDGAMEEFRRSWRLAHTARTATSICTAQFFRGAFANAVQWAERATRLQPEDPMTWGNLGDAQARVAHRREAAGAAYRHAITLMRRHLRRSPRDPEARARLACWLVKIGRGDDATREIRRALRDAPADATVLLDAAVVAEWQGKRREVTRFASAATRAGMPRHVVHRVIAQSAPPPGEG